MTIKHYLPVFVVSIYVIQIWTILRKCTSPRGAMDQRVGLLIQRLWVRIPPWVLLKEQKNSQYDKNSVRFVIFKSCKHAKMIISCNFSFQAKDEKTIHTEMWSKSYHKQKFNSFAHPRGCTQYTMTETILTNLPFSRCFRGAIGQRVRLLIERLVVQAHPGATILSQIFISHFLPISSRAFAMCFLRLLVRHYDQFMLF